jgi:FixJ family two-component response regulator
MEDRVLVLAPRGRDAVIAGELLERNAIRVLICEGQAMLLDAIRAGAGAVLLTEEALAADDPQPLAAWVASQPNWSDVPFVVLANGAPAPRTVKATTRLADLGNVVLLERPLHAEAMLGAIRSALKARRRQYQVRDAAETLERAVVDRTVELERARQSLEIALDAAGMGSWDIDLVTGETHRTPRHDEIFGHVPPLAHWGLETFLDHVDVAQRPAIAKAFDEALVGGDDAAFDIERAARSWRRAACAMRRTARPSGSPASSPTSPTRRRPTRSSPRRARWMRSAS